MQPFAKAKRQLKHPLVRSKNQDIPRRIQDRRTDFAMLQVPLHLFQNIRWKGLVQIAGDVRPNMLALYRHVHHLRLGAISFNCGARFFCNIMRARCNRTFTDPVVMPSAAAASFTLNCSISRS